MPKLEDLEAGGDSFAFTETSPLNCPVHKLKQRDTSPPALSDPQIKLWLGGFSLNYLLSAALLVKGNMDNAAGNSNGHGELMLSATVLNVCLIWDYYTFSATSNRDAQMRSVLSIVGLTIVALSGLLSVPAIVQEVGNNINVWGFAYGAMLVSLAKLWDCWSAGTEDGTIRIPFVNACLGLSFLFSSLYSLLKVSMPTTAYYLMIFTDMAYMFGAILVTFRFVSI